MMSSLYQAEKSWERVVRALFSAMSLHFVVVNGQRSPGQLGRNQFRQTGEGDLALGLARQVLEHRRIAGPFLGAQHHRVAGPPSAGQLELLPELQISEGVFDRDVPL